MKKQKIQSLIFAAIMMPCALGAMHVPAAAQDKMTAPWPTDEGVTPVLVLGTFHFADQGRDSYRPRFDIDVRSAARQAEVEELIAQLAAFRPTRVAVEREPERQVHLDSLYRAYLAGDYELGANEIYQIGFRLAERLGHERVWAVDAQGRWYDSVPTQEQWEAAVAERPAVDTTWRAHYFRMYAWEDSVKTTIPLVDVLLGMNDPERLLRGHGAYLVGRFELSSGTDDYFGVDAVTAWYNRNLRIFRNLQRLVTGPDERILLLIGAGHVPIIRHAIEASPEFRLVEVGEYLTPTR